ncbi:unnamed protein product [Urochloa humidicola]
MYSASVWPVGLTVLLQKRPRSARRRGTTSSSEATGASRSPRTNRRCRRRCTASSSRGDAAAGSRAKRARAGDFPTKLGIAAVGSPQLVRRRRKTAEQTRRARRWRRDDSGRWNGLAQRRPPRPIGEEARRGAGGRVSLPPYLQIRSGEGVAAEMAVGEPPPRWKRNWARAAALAPPPPRCTAATLEEVAGPRRRVSSSSTLMRRCRAGEGSGPAMTSAPPTSSLSMKKAMPS